MVGSSIKEIEAGLTGPGSLLEIEEADIGGQTVRVWKHALNTLPDVFEASRAFAERTFLVYEDKKVTYEAFYRATRTLAADLQARGLGKGDVVSILLPNSPEWTVAWFAIALIGAVSSPLNPNLRPDELLDVLRDNGARAVICGDQAEAKLAGILERFADVCTVLTAGEKPHVIAGMTSLSDIIGPCTNWADLAGVPDVARNISPDDDAVLYYTSGTTGRPKGVRTTHRANAYSIAQTQFVVARARAMAGVFEPVSDPHTIRQQVNLLTAPFHHVSGSASALLFPMTRGAKVVLMRWWSPDEALRLIERERVNVLGGVPMIATQVYQHPRRHEFDLSSLKQLTYGGAPPPPHLNDDLHRAGKSALQVWGMTETCGAVIGHMGPDLADHPGSCGFVSPLHDLRVVDMHGEVLPAGEIGELCLRGPQVMRGYWNRPEETAAVLSPDGWLRTGDLARIDAEGYCFIVDRAKDMLICAGENIYCPEIEAALLQHPDVADCAALGAPHPQLGEEPVAVVVPRSGAAITVAELRIFLARRLASNKVPVRMVVTPEPLPRNDVGKVVKSRLRGLFTVNLTEDVA